MFLSEPSTTPYDLQFRIAGVPVRVHPLFWLGGLVMGASNDLVGVLLWIAVIFVSILIHELGHAFAMRRFGESPRVVLYLMGGLAIADGGGNPWGGRSKGRHPLEQIIISAAGPAAGFLFAALVVLGTHLAGGQVIFHTPDIRNPVFWEVASIRDKRMDALVWDLLSVNILWGLVNLLPVLPLDGGQIARQLFTMRDPWDGVRKSLLLSAIVGAAFAAIGILYWKNIFVGMLFGSLAASSFMALQQMGGWSGRGGGRPW